MALLVARAAGVEDPNLIVAIAGVVGFLPAAITWLVDVVRGASVDEPAGRAA